MPQPSPDRDTLRRGKIHILVASRLGISLLGNKYRRAVVSADRLFVSCVTGCGFSREWYGMKQSASRALWLAGWRAGVGRRYNWHCPNCKHLTEESTA